MIGTLLSVGTPLFFMRKQFNVPTLETQTREEKKEGGWVVVVKRSDYT